MAHDIHRAAENHTGIPLEELPQLLLLHLPILLDLQQRIDLAVAHRRDAGAGRRRHRVHDDTLRDGEGHSAQGGEGEAGHEEGLQRGAGEMDREGREGGRWGGEEARDAMVWVREGGEVEDSQGVEECVGFGVGLAAGEADGVRGSGVVGRRDVAPVGGGAAQGGFRGVVGGGGV
jgi:hypothetical protein